MQSRKKENNKSRRRMRMIKVGGWIRISSGSVFLFSKLFSSHIFPFLFLNRAPVIVTRESGHCLSGVHLQPRRVRMRVRVSIEE